MHLKSLLCCVSVGWCLPKGHLGIKHRCIHPVWIVYYGKTWGEVCSLERLQDMRTMGNGAGNRTLFPLVIFLFRRPFRTSISWALVYRIWRFGSSFVATFGFGVYVRSMGESGYWKTLGRMLYPPKHLPYQDFSVRQGWTSMLKTLLDLDVWEKILVLSTRFGGCIPNPEASPFHNLWHLC